MKSYQFRAEIEPDEGGWSARCPALERYGAFIWGETEGEAYRLIEEVVGMTIESMVELGMPIPEETHDAAKFEGCRVVSVQANLKATLKETHLTKTYQFQVVVEPDENQWAAYCPALVERGAATCGYTREEAYINIHQVLRMTLESMISHGETIPADALALSGETIAVTV